MRAATPLSLVLALAVSSCAAADTIVLHNGKRIEASEVTEAKGRVTYETDAGEFSIPQSLVDHIERDTFSEPPDAAPPPASAAPPTSGAPPASAPNPGASPAARPSPGETPSLPAPSASIASRQAPAAAAEAAPARPVQGYEDVARSAVHDDAIDFGYLARADMDARTGGAPAAAKSAAAHHAAAQFLIGKGDVDTAIDQYNQALAFSPDNVGLLLNLASLYLRESQFTAALDPLEHARRVAPNSAEVAKLMGWAYRGADKIDQAVTEWQRSERLQRDPEVEQALAKAQRDKSEEDSYRQGETTHFELKYNGNATPDLARDILHTLEDDFQDLESQLDYTPPESIAVILYTNQAFGDITRAPGWVGALNDGRLRIPVQGLTGVTPDLARVLKHELTHSFVGQKSHGRAPTWLQEGIAQYMEGRRSSNSAGALVAAASQGGIPSLGQMEGSWMSLSANSAGFAYAWSLAVVEAIIDAGGVSDISRLLDRVATSPSTEAATQETLHSNYSDLQDATVTYLKREYLR